MKNKLIIFSLIIMLCFGELTPIHAAKKETKQNVVIEIATAEDLLNLAEDCSYDAYSIGKTVELVDNINLLGIEFSGIPYFNGTFNGNGYTISGLNLKQIGSQVGFFRYVGELGEVINLNVMGNILPTGTQNEVGGIAGVNYGVIERCSFAGTVFGQECVGGIVGANKLFATVSECTSNALVLATNRTGGIAGANEGTIEKCVNKSKVNIEELEPVLEIEGMDIGDLNIAQTLITRNNTGGIAGFSNGFIDDSKNYGEIGYQHTGYNVGGIVGYQSGIVANCSNFGTVLGRKDVGGIVGQAAPYVESEFLKERTSQLENSMKRMERTMKNLQSTIGKLPEDVGMSADDQGNVTVERQDRDTLTKTLNERMESVEKDLNTLANQAKRLGNQVNQLAVDAKESPIEDVSSVKNAGKMDGVISECVNRGNVEGDLNVGGIAGTMNIESTDDPEADSDIKLDVATRTELNDVIITSTNYGNVTGKKNCVGGIVGLQELGLVYDCEGYGSIGATAGSYIGGVVGMSRSTIQKSHSMADLSGNHYIGGIAGLGTNVTECLSMVTIDSEGECLGALIGISDEAGEVADNYFVKVGYDGIDNISYAGMAEPISYETMLEQKDVPAGFNQVKITFVADGEKIDEKMVPYGYTLQESMLPEVENRKDSYVVWPEMADYANITGNVTIEAEYHPWVQSISSNEKYEEKDLAIMVGKYYEDTNLLLKETEADIVLSEGSRICYAYSWEIVSPKEKNITSAEAHLYIPQTDGVIELWVDNGEGYRLTSYIEDGSYLVAEIPYGAEFALVEVPVDNSGLYTTIAIGAVVLVLVISVVIVHNKRRKKAD